jgi:carbon starvation protein
MVAAWGYFLYQGVTDPLGGINSLWPLFGIANQLLAVIALCVATSIIIKMNKTRYAWVSLVPMLWLVVVTQTAAYQKMFDPNPRIGFLADATRLSHLIEDGGVSASRIADTQRLIFNNRLDAAITGLFAAMILVVIVASAKEWIAVLSGRKIPVLREAEYILSATSD